MDLGNEGNSTPKRHRQKGSAVGGGDMIPVDRISSLPESIISHILSLLPTKSAVLTSFLSKNWRLRWTQITAFDFDDQLWPSSSEPGEMEMNFVRFVNLVFASVKDSVHKLRLRWRSSLLRPVYLNMWLNAAISRNIRDLDLYAVSPSGERRPNHSDENYEFGLPIALYTCATLEVLKLEGPFRVKLPYGVSLPKLAVLELICVKFECDESVEKLVSACPMLHSFKIKRCHYHGDLLVCKVSSHSLKRVQIYLEEGCRSCISADDLKLVIDTPMLKHLVVDSEAISKITCVQREMPVKELEIYSFCESNRPFGDGVAGLIKACNGVKVMKFWEPTVLALGRGTTPLPATFGRLTKLVVDFTCSHWTNLLDLVDRCVNLRVLDITACEIVHEDDAERILISLGGSFWRHPVRVPCCLSSSLKHVYIRLFEGLEDEMAMLKFILDHGLLLETVTLCSTHWFLSTGSIDVIEKFNILNKVSMLPRASATCTISFLDGKGF